MVIGIFIISLLIASGCAVNKETMNAYNEAKETFQKATLIGAKKCAPCQYATAEAYLSIADHEIKDYWRELEYLDKHIKIVKEKSLEAIRICEKPPTPPTVAPPPKPIVPPPAVAPPPPPTVAPIPPPPPVAPPPPIAVTPPPAVAPPPAPPAPVAPPPPAVAPPPKPAPPAPPPVAVAPSKPVPPPPPPKPPVAPVFETVYFDINKSNISPNASKALDKNGMILEENPQIKVIIEGHADSTGPEKLNQILSEKRAESAKKYIIDKFNISPDRMRTKGYGSKRPVADNATKEGRTKNRRVEFRIIQ